jgi:hypothetical protein
MTSYGSPRMPPAQSYSETPCGTSSVVDHHAIRTEVHPIGIRVLEDVHDAGPEIAAAVERVPLRRGKLEDVDIVAA